MNTAKGIKGFVTRPLIERFNEKVVRRGDDICWSWLGTTDGQGYPQIWADGRSRRATQVAWEMHHERPFPDGAMACHSCDNPNCVNPRHIWPGTNLDNVRDSQAKGRWKGGSPRKSHCLHGHEMAEENTAVGKDGKRRCITCRRAQSRAQYHAWKEANAAL